jgi:2-amino-4-hydroxy-6-hydroxymethyldihydropteridine diphosphokinase
MPAREHSTIPGTLPCTRAGKRPALDTADSRAGPPPAAAAIGQQGWRTALACRRRRAVSGATQLYAIAIGSNRPHGRHGRPTGVVEAAIALLDQEFDLFDAASILLNPAHGGAGRDFANSVALVESELPPPDMLARLKEIERGFGRRQGRRWGPRVLDLDIVAWSGGKWRSRGLTIPHKSASDRSFVIGPLASIAPDWPLEGTITAQHFAHRLARRSPRG